MLSGAQRQARLRQRRGPPIKAYVEHKLRELVTAYAKQRRMTVTDVVRAALREYLQAKGEPLPPDHQGPSAVQCTSR